jgi:L-rhamnose mutarotase
MQHYCLAVDLADDPVLIGEYEKYHEKVWPEILDSLTACGILQMEIYRLGNRMTMFIETTDQFTFEKKASMDAANPIVQKWETLMWKYQQSLPLAKAGEKWMRMKKVFDLQEQKH